jgi:hypothetical protein
MTAEILLPHMIDTVEIFLSPTVVFSAHSSSFPSLNIENIHKAKKAGESMLSKIVIN